MTENKAQHRLRTWPKGEGGQELKGITMATWQNHSCKSWSYVPWPWCDHWFKCFLGGCALLGFKKCTVWFKQEAFEGILFWGPTVCNISSLMNDCFLSTQIDDCFGSSSLLHELALFLQVSAHSLLKRPTPRSLQMWWIRSLWLVSWKCRKQLELQKGSTAIDSINHELHWLDNWIPKREP